MTTNFVVRHLSQGRLITEQIQDTVQGLNSVAARIANAANEQLGSGSADMHYVKDGERISAVVNIQFGKSKGFANSEICRAEIYNTDSIKLILTDTISGALNIDQYNSFNNVEAAIQFINRMASKLRA